VVSPEGKLIERVPVPDPGPTNLCFGGAGLRTAYVTLGNTSKLIALDWPRPGTKLNFQPD
jgi:gluconolactonase